MLKAKRNFKAEVQKQEKQEPVKKENKEKIVVEAQKHEVGRFLKQEMKKSRPFPFLADMYKRLYTEDRPLTDNMLTAVRRCMKRAEDWANGKPRKITLKISPFIMRELGIDSRVITGNIKAETAKAWLIEGYADMVENLSYCARCGRELTEPASQVTGFGETCAKKMGIPYDPSGVLSAPERVRKEIRNQFRKKLNNQKFTRWIPKSRAEVIVETTG